MLRIVRTLPSKTIKLELYRATNPKYYSSRDGGPLKKRSGTGTVYTLGALALVGGATLAYAKYDEEFRKTLTNTAPFTDTLIKYIFQEESVTDALSSYYGDVKQSVSNLVGGSEAPKKKPIQNISEKFEKEYKAPPPIIPALEKESPKKPEQLYTEIRLEQKSKGEEEAKINIVGNTKPSDNKLAETHPKNLTELEEQICSAAAQAVNAYSKALYNLKIYNEEVSSIIDDSIDRIHPSTWDSIKRKTKEKNDSLNLAKEKTDQAKTQIKKLKELIDKPDYEGTRVTRETIKLHLEKFENDIKNIKKEFQYQEKIGSATEHYWDKVQLARRHFSDELESLFPNVDLNKKQLNINSEELDLFLLHAYSHVLLYQKELAKMESVLQQKILTAVEAAKKGGFELLSNAQICEAVEQEKRKLTECFQQQCLKLRHETATELREQLKRQSQAFSDHLEDAVKTRGLEIERVLARKFDEDLEAERCKFKLQMAAMIGRLRGLDVALKARDETEKASKQSQVLWSACQALLRAVRAGCPGVAWKDQLRPLEPEILAVKKAAAEGDELVDAVVNGIPREAKTRGVFPEDALRERFLKVETVARNMALVPEYGAPLPVHILSYIQGLLLFKSASPIPQAELNDEVVDFSKLNTNEILQRARYWLDRGDFVQTLKYMNLLKGAPRLIAKQWMNETRILLETQQAANALMAHAASSGLMYL